METIEIQDVLDESSEEETFFGKPPQPWQRRNNWIKPKRKRKSRKVEIDLWREES